MSSDPGNAALHLLAEPTRRRVYDAVRAGDGPQTREAVANAAGISKRLAAFHLDLLAEGGLLDVDYARPPGRSGPGAGRPAKRYRPAQVDIELHVPARRYDLAARILARAVTESGPGADPQQQALHVARDEGEQIGRLRRPGGRLSAAATLDTAEQVLNDLGYEPSRSDDRCVRLRNCPFRSVVDVAPALVCGVNDELVTGMLEGLGGHRSVTAALDGAPPDCCVTVARR
ncbi:MAG TPA: helix-turn-helix domain-containing protein [Mycobacteriales bacterium]|nr:helix-turn-helix domain-containing protein [Mycobacteriales bacterium]